jgi:hypothetical protein
MAQPPKGATAEDFMRSLEANPDYIARRAAQAAATAELAGVCAEDEARLIAELQQVGVRTNSVYDFVNEDGAPSAAVPILVRHLAVPHHPSIWEGIVRALAVPHARDAALETLRTAYRSEADPHRRWVIANSLGSMARLREVEDLPGIREYSALFRQSRKRRPPPLA